MKKKFLSLVLCLLLCFSTTFFSYEKAYAAEGPLLNIVGSFNVEGLSGNDYIRKLAPVVGTALAIIVGKCGMDVAITAESASQGMTKTQYLTNKFAEMAADANMSVLEAYQTVCSGLQYTKDGALVFSSKVKTLFGNFLDWAFNKNYVVENLDFSYVNGGYHLFPLPYSLNNTSGKVISFEGNSSTYVYFTSRGTNQYYFYFLSKNPTSVNVFNNGVRTSTMELKSLWGVDNSYYSVGSTISSYDNLTVSSGAWDSTREWDKIGGTDIDILVGLPDALQNPAIDDLQDLTDDEQIVIDAGFLEQLIQSLGLARSADIALADYVDALARAIDGLATRDLVDTAGVPIGSGTMTGTIPLAGNSALDILKVPAQSIPGTQEGTEGITKPEYETGVEDYTFDLTGIFPFCIPFDIYKFLEVLRADPQAPNFDLRFYIPNLVDQNIHIDLSDFDPVARILRTGEIILFCIGLGFATKKIIKW